MNRRRLRGTVRMRQLKLSLPPELRADLQRIADQNRLSVGEVIRRLCERGLADHADISGPAMVQAQMQLTCEKHWLGL